MEPDPLDSSCLDPGKFGSRPPQGGGVCRWQALAASLNTQCVSLFTWELTELLGEVGELLDTLAEGIAEPRCRRESKWGLSHAPSGEASISSHSSSSFSW